jgi:hypothetical protein
MRAKFGDYFRRLCRFAPRWRVARGEKARRRAIDNYGIFDYDWCLKRPPVLNKPTRLEDSFMKSSSSGSAWNARSVNFIVPAGAIVCASGISYGFYLISEPFSVLESTALSLTVVLLLFGFPLILIYWLYVAIRNRR